VSAVSESPCRRGAQPAQEPDIVFALPSRPAIQVGRCLLLAAVFVCGLWNLVTGAGGWDAVPAIVRVFAAIVCAAVAQHFVRGALEHWQTRRRVPLGPAAERIDSPDTSC